MSALIDEMHTVVQDVDSRLERKLSECLAREEKLKASLTRIRALGERVEQEGIESFDLVDCFFAAVAEAEYALTS
jgi:DNA invertase Pin-like site-specific DNA recombinase